jgi:2-polyprenyl-6-methoxyphenol hydroxylase-like FAD-dependent oxidoreductase
MAVYVDKLRLMDAMTAEDICSIDLGEPFRKRFGNPYAVVHRGDLHGVFQRACLENPRITIRTRCTVENYEQDGGSVTVHLAGGETVTGGLLVGADGLWSKVPLSDWKVFNLVVTYHNDAPAPVAGLPVTEEEVMAGFQHVHPKARDIIRHGHDWKLWVLCDRDPVENWIDGRVALLGDAAHPTLQYMAQGACMAMEDGVCLSHELAASPNDHEAALERYRRQRVLRTARIQLQSRAMGEHVLHPAGAHAALRNAIMSAKSDSEWYDNLAWLYGGTGLGVSI